MNDVDRAIAITDAAMEATTDPSDLERVADVLQSAVRIYRSAAKINRDEFESAGEVLGRGTYIPTGVEVMGDKLIVTVAHYIGGSPEHSFEFKIPPTEQIESSLKM